MAYKYFDAEANGRKKNMITCLHHRLYLHYSEDSHRSYRQPGTGTETGSEEFLFDSPCDSHDTTVQLGNN